MNNMTPEEVKELISEAMTGAVRAIVASPDVHCKYRFDPTQHEAEHEAVRKFMRVMGKVDDIKWSVVQKIVIALVLGMFTLMGYGIILKLGVLDRLGLLWVR